MTGAGEDLDNQSFVSSDHLSIIDVNGEETEEKSPLVKRDSTNVRISLVFVLGMLAVTASLVVTMTYLFLSDASEDEFETAFLQQANVINEATKFHAEAVTGYLDAMSDTITSYTSSTGQEWPFVELPDFDKRGQGARTHAYIETVGFTPLVTFEDRDRWAEYSLNASSSWTGTSSAEMIPFIWKDAYKEEQDDDDEAAIMIIPDDNILMAPLWQTHPAPFDAQVINYNLLSDSLYQYLFGAMRETQNTALSAVHTGIVQKKLWSDTAHADYHGTPLVEDAKEFPHSALITPVYDSFDEETRNLAAVVHGILPWDTYFTNLLPPGVDGIVTVLANSCGQLFTFRINGPQALFVGEGDLHNPKFDSLVVEARFGSDFITSESKTYQQCFYSLFIYPSDEFKETYASNETALFTSLVALVFVATMFVFFVFVWFVARRQNKVMAIAQRTLGLVSNLFPENVRDQLLREAEEQANREAKNGNAGTTSARLQTILDNGYGENKPLLSSRPIADLYPECTVMFCDIAGFTSWSSVREPTAVFHLLESLYSMFDKLAKRLRVFKVETIGDCYLAVCGLPDACPQHAVVMTRFARECLAKSEVLFKDLEEALGPETGDLSIRIGLNSGPVTAGVLRGEKGRYQLFGDAVNTAARMESTGASGRIHITKDTADILIAAGKKLWIRKREDKVVAKGKGEMDTYWVVAKGATGSVHSSNSGIASSQAPVDDSALLDAAGVSIGGSGLSESKLRLVNWNVQLLAQFLKRIVASRTNANAPQEVGASSELQLNFEPGHAPFDEWKDQLHLPAFNYDSMRRQNSAEDTELTTEVMAQLREFVIAIASTYRDNPFHSFSHASHVTMSVCKLLERILSTNTDATTQMDEKAGALERHQRTYGITSDPMLQFAAILSAVGHDADHPGVPNDRLCVENPDLAAVYKSRSVAEQHSIDIVWNLLMSDMFVDLRGAIYTTQEELEHFRSLFVNSVLATDVVDKSLKTLRNKGWDMAFASTATATATDDGISNTTPYQASAVLQHLIQASDVAHTMQHWHVYRKWNECFFDEMYKAYVAGRSDNDPSESWYSGEIGFFDFYILPLARKLKDCGVFGVSSSEYLDYAKKNREEWESKGKQIVAEMLAKAKAKYGER